MHKEELKKKTIIRFSFIENFQIAPYTSFWFYGLIKTCN